MPLYFNLKELSIHFYGDSIINSLFSLPWLYCCHYWGTFLQFDCSAFLQQVMDRLFPMVPSLLSHSGAFYLVVISENCPDDIKRVMYELGFDMHIVKERKVRGEHLLVLKFVRK
jgi:hypothetical protein